MDPIPWYSYKANYGISRPNYPAQNHSKPRVSNAEVPRRKLGCTTSDETHLGANAFDSGHSRLLNNKQIP